MVIWLNQNPLWTKCVLHLVHTIVAAVLLSRYLTDNLGPNPFDYLMMYTGWAAWITLIETLLITPLRRWATWTCRYFKCARGKRLSDWNFLIKSRRLLGLWSFVFALAHLSCYLWFEAGFDWLFLGEELLEKAYLQLGLVAFLLYVILALTSPQPVQKRMGKWWRRTHRSVYLLATVLMAHVFLQEKLGSSHYTLLYMATCGLLLYRISVRFMPALRRKEDDGLEHKR